MPTILKERKTIITQSERGPALAWSPDGKILVCGNSEGTIDLWDPVGSRISKRLSGHDAALTNIAFSPDGTTLASADEFTMSDTVKLWDITTDRRWQTLGDHDDHIYDIVFSPDGSLLASVAGDVKLWEVQTGREIRTFDGWITAAFNPDGTAIATRVKGGSKPTEYGLIKIWDVATGQEKQVLQGRPINIDQIAFSPDGMTLVSIGRDKNNTTTDYFSIWDLVTGQELVTWHSNYDLWSFAIHPSGHFLATNGLSKHPHKDNMLGRISLWDTKTGQVLQRIFLSLPPGRIDFSPDGKLMACSSRGSINLWEVDCQS